ncbi:hypothetical protein GEMRC1_012119 [Eukaryota sp. GEM-RC1]
MSIAKVSSLPAVWLQIKSNFSFTDLISFAPDNSLFGNTQSPRIRSLSTTSDHLLLLCSDRCIRILDAKSLLQAHSIPFESRPTSLTGVTLTNSPSTIWCGTSNKELIIYNSTDFSLVKRISSFSHSITSVFDSPTLGVFVITANGHVRLYNRTEGTFLSDISSFDDPVRIFTAFQNYFSLLLISQ